MKRINLFLIAAVTLLLAACNTNEPTKAYEGVWEPVLFDGIEVPDLFIISSDSIKAYSIQLKEEYYQCHYKVVGKDIVELERCWAKQNNYPESLWKAEVSMYIDEQDQLVIKDFDPSIELHQNYPNYANLKLRRHENKY